MPRRIKSSFSHQCDGSVRTLSAAFSCRWNRSTRPLELGGYDIVRTRFESNSRISSFHRHESNRRPLSVEMVEGTPKRDIQLLTKARATVSAVISVIGMALGHHVNRSMQVSMYLNSLEGGSGPTMSICIMSNRASEVAKVDMGVTVCR